MVDKVVCPCCGYRTLTNGPGAYDWCGVCHWEDDGAEPWEVGGPNGISLVEAQHLFLSRSPLAVMRRLRQRVGPGPRTRQPRSDEARDTSWRPITRTPELRAKVRQAYAEEEAEQARLHAEVALRAQPLPAPLMELNSRLDALGAVARSLPYPEVLARYRAATVAVGMGLPDSTLELMARLLHDPHWRLRRPDQVIGWLWRHRSEGRLRQLATGGFTIAG